MWVTARYTQLAVGDISGSYIASRQHWVRLDDAHPVAVDVLRCVGDNVLPYLLCVRPEKMRVEVCRWVGGYIVLAHNDVRHFAGPAVFLDEGDQEVGHR